MILSYTRTRRVLLLCVFFFFSLYRFHLYLKRYARDEILADTDWAYITIYNSRNGIDVDQVDDHVS